MVVSHKYEGKMLRAVADAMRRFGDSANDEEVVEKLSLEPDGSVYLFCDEERLLNFAILVGY